MSTFGRKSKRSSGQTPIVITHAQDPLSQEQKGRQMRYFISMMVRTACFIATIFLPSPYRWIALFGALVLPYVAVVVANAGRENSSDMNARMIAPNRELN